MRPDYVASGRLAGRIAIITGGDSGIGGAVAVAFAKEGADLIIVYKDETTDAKETRALIEAEGRKCLLITGDLGKPAFCKKVVEQTMKKFERLDVLINNAAEQHPQEQIGDILPEQLQRTFATNVFSMFYLTAAAHPHLKNSQGCVINSTSVTAFRGSGKLLDYSSSKGAVLPFTRSLSSYSSSTIRTTHVSGMFTNLGISVGHALQRRPVS